ncbi:hypothetical protein Plhal304r1_c021g0075601 [Plasmopara halstedii]
MKVSTETRNSHFDLILKSCKNDIEVIMHVTAQWWSDVVIQHHINIYVCHGSLLQSHYRLYGQRGD